MAEKQNRYWLGDSKKKYRQYQKDFVKRTYSGFTIRLNNTKDLAAIEALNSLKNKTEYVRDLLMADLNGARTIDKYDKKPQSGRREWIVDKPAWTETVHHPAKGHWVIKENTETE